jgi:hypothetical protein
MHLARAQNLWYIRTWLGHESKLRFRIFALVFCLQLLISKVLRGSEILWLHWPRIPGTLQCVLVIAAC